MHRMSRAHQALRGILLCAGRGLAIILTGLQIEHTVSREAEMEENRSGIEELLWVVKRLRDEDGCPWDRVQTHESLKPECIEEAAEVIGGIDILSATGRPENLVEELGDLLLQVVFHARIGEEEGLFTFDEVARASTEKMIRRHPHVFGTDRGQTEEELLQKWNEIKAAEKAGREWESAYLRGAMEESEELLQRALERKHFRRPAPKADIYLSSSPCPWGEEELFAAEGFAKGLRRSLVERCGEERVQSGVHTLFVASDPKNPEHTALFAKAMEKSFAGAGMPFSQLTVLEGTNVGQAKELLQEADLVILAGGHVPTQNDFFQSMDLREKIQSFVGVILGISAGSMNSADLVYSQPELPGESAEAFVRFREGLGLTDVMLLPHFNETRDMELDGRRLFEDLTFADSKERQFLAIPDGSYLHVHGQWQVLCGEGWIIEDGWMCQIAGAGDRTVFSMRGGRLVWERL